MHPRQRIPLTRPERLVLLGFLSAVLALVSIFGLVDPAAFRAFFAWPVGGIWANLVASAFWGIPAFYAILRRMAHQHAEQLRTLHLHHEQQVNLLIAHHNLTRTEPDDHLD